MKKTKRILLILSHKGTKNTFLNKYVYNYYYPSITLEQLISITPDKYEVECIDERYEKVDFNWTGDLVGISTLTPNSLHAYYTSNEFRRRGKTVILGGYHPSSVPNEAKKYADTVVIGEAEISWPQLLKDYENGALKPYYRAPIVDPKKIPSPKRLEKNYPYIGIIQATRGCPYGCKFCSIQNVEGSVFRSRPIGKVIQEINSIESKRFMFADSSLTINSKYTKQLFKNMIALNKKFSAYGNINVLRYDDELLDLANKAGCETWLIGLESINQESIKSIGKTTNKVIEYSSAIKKIRDYGMNVIGLFIFGFDTDKSDIFKTTLEAINEWDLDRAGFAILTPFPGTELFNNLVRQNRILTKNWKEYNLRNVVFQPKNMSVKKLKNGRNAISKEFYSLKNCFRRNIEDKDLNFNRFLRRTIGDYVLNRYFKDI